MFVTLSLVICFAYLVYVYGKWNFDYWTKRGVVGPKPTAFVGNFPKSLNQSENQLYAIERFYRQYKADHPFIGIFSMRTPQILLLSPEIIKNVLIKNFKNFHDNAFGDMIDKDSDPIFARNPFMLNGEEWKEKRAEVTPAFTNNRIRALYPLIENVCAKLVKYTKQMSEENKKDGLDTRELAAKYTTDVVSTCIFAMDGGSFSKKDSEIRKAANRIMLKPNFVLVIKFIISSMLPSLKKLIKLNFIPKDVEIFFTDLLNQALRYRKDNNITRIDYLDYLSQLKDKKNLTELDLAGHTITFFVDGFDTSSVFISHALFLLAANPETQDKLRSEIAEKILENGAINYDILEEMTYLEQVVNETLRIYSPAAFLARKCTIPTELIAAKEKVVKIDKDMALIVPVHSLHNDEQYYKNPEKFDPDRFSPENGGVKSYRDRGVYMPFGDGPRICLGKRFAMCQSKVAIVELIRNFNITVNCKTQQPILIDPKEFITFPKGGYWLNYTSIEI